MPISLLNSIISKKEALKKASQEWWGRNKEDKENQIFPILRNRKHVSGVLYAYVPTKSHLNLLN